MTTEATSQSGGAKTALQSAAVPGLNRAGHFARIDAALASQDPQAALEFCDAAGTHLGGDQALLLKRATALQRVGRVDEAVALLRGARLPDIHSEMHLAHLLGQAGRFGDADAICDQILKKSPDHRQAILRRIDLALAGGFVEAARALLSARPASDLERQDMLLRRMQIERQSRQHAEALRLAKRLVSRWPNVPEHAVRLADIIMDEEPQSEEAEKLLRRVMTLNPWNTRARMLLARILAERGDAGAALCLIRSGISRKAGELEASWTDFRPGLANLMLTGLKITEELDATADEEQILSSLTANSARLTDLQMTRVLDHAVGRNLSDVISRLVAEIRTRRAVQPVLALKLLEIAHVLGHDPLAADLKRSLRARVPESRRLVYDLLAARLLHGVLAARQALRDRQRGVRSTEDVVQIATALREAGEIPLALRYVRRCRRAWPDSRPLLHAEVAALQACGQPHQAVALLEAKRQATPDPGLEEALLHARAQTGRLDDCREWTRNLSPAAKKRTAQFRLMLALACNDLEAAREASADLRKVRGKTQQGNAHFSATHLGALLNELTLTRQVDRTTPSEVLVANYVAPARAVLRDWCGSDGRTAAGERATAAPKQIFQYWNTPDLPEPVAEMVASWRSAPNWRHTLLDRQGALRWLASAFGPRHVRAFRLANNVAEECDFLRLCLLAKEGGVYADADDRLVGSLDELTADHRGALVFREEFGVVANNFLCSAEHHPLFLRAAEAACISLLGRDNESTWSKTGPGLLTRIAASQILEDPRSMADSMSVLPSYMLRRHVLEHTFMPHKKTASHWNQQVDRVSEKVGIHLMRLAS